MERWPSGSTTVGGRGFGSCSSPCLSPARSGCFWSSSSFRARRVRIAMERTPSRPTGTTWSSHERAVTHRQRRHRPEPGARMGDPHADDDRRGAGVSSPDHRCGLGRRRALQHGRADREFRESPPRYAEAQSRRKLLAFCQDDPGSAGATFRRAPRRTAISSTARSAGTAASASSWRPSWTSSRTPALSALR